MASEGVPSGGVLDEREVVGVEDLSEQRPVCWGGEGTQVLRGECVCRAVVERNAETAVVEARAPAQAVWLRRVLPKRERPAAADAMVPAGNAGVGAKAAQRS